MRYPILALISFCDFEVKIDRFQIKQNILNLKWTLVPKYMCSTFEYNKSLLTFMSNKYW